MDIEEVVVFTKSKVLPPIRSSLSDVNLSTTMISSEEDGDEVPVDSPSPAWALALPELYFTCILPVYCSVILLASLGGSQA